GREGRGGEERQGERSADEEAVEHRSGSGGSTASRPAAGHGISDPIGRQGKAPDERAPGIA
ncbi:hypothetical protein ACFPYM_11580, partial [Methylobacterium hispanicum]